MKSVNFKKMLINFRKKVALALFLLCVKGKEEIHKDIQYSVYDWHGLQCQVYDRHGSHWDWKNERYFPVGEFYPKYWKNQKITLEI